MTRPPSKKKLVLATLFKESQKSGKPRFSNKDIKKVCEKVGFSNQFDVTKVDHSHLLPEEMLSAGYCVAHLGEGKHQFIPALKQWYRQLEEITAEETEDFKYIPSLLNHTDSSESNAISVAYNQRIIHMFLYGSVGVHFKIYMSRRTKFTGSYRVGDCKLDVCKMQMEMDATFEKDGVVTIFEAKNGEHDDFSVYQLFHPFLSYFSQGIPGVKKINCCYLVKHEGKENKSNSSFDLRLYEFPVADDMSSIRLVKKARYVLLPGEEQ